MSRFYKKITAFGTPSSLDPHTIQNAGNGGGGNLTVGNGPPTEPCEDGTFYLDIDTKTYYKCENGTWTLILSLITTSLSCFDASVGPTGDFSTVQEAYDAGHRKILVTGDALVGQLGSYDESSQVITHAEPITIHVCEGVKLTWDVFDTYLSDFNLEGSGEINVTVTLTAEGCGAPRIIFKPDSTINIKDVTFSRYSVPDGSGETISEIAWFWYPQGSQLFMHNVNSYSYLFKWVSNICGQIPDNVLNEEGLKNSIIDGNYLRNLEIGGSLINTVISNNVIRIDPEGSTSKFTGSLIILSEAESDAIKVIIDGNDIENDIVFSNKTKGTKIEDCIINNNFVGGFLNFEVIPKNTVISGNRIKNDILRPGPSTMDNGNFLSGNIAGNYGTNWNSNEYIATNNRVSV
jgi:hypothetical protein